MSGSEPETATAAAPSPAVGSHGLVREPRQARSRRTLERILEAGLELLREEGPEGLTVTAITRRARTSVGSFYARFDEKDDLLRYLGERSLERALEEWDDTVGAEAPASDLRAAAREVVDALGALHLEGPARALALLAGVEDPPPTRRSRFEDRLARDLRLLSAAPEIRARLAARVVTGLLHDAAHRSAGGPGDEARAAALPDADALLPELVELLVGYLGGEGRAAPAQGDDAARREPRSPAGPGSGPRVDPASDPTSVPSAEPAPDSEPSAAPDPFEIWE